MHGSICIIFVIVQVQLPGSACAFHVTETSCLKLMYKEKRRVRILPNLVLQVCILTDIRNFLIHVFM